MRDILKEHALKNLPNLIAKRNSLEKLLNEKTKLCDQIEAQLKSKQQNNNLINQQKQSDVEKVTFDIDRCLKQVGIYKAPSLVRSHAIQACSAIPTLSPKIGSLSLCKICASFKNCLTFLFCLFV